MAQVPFEVLRPNGIGNCFRMLIRRRVDVVLTSESVGLHEMKSMDDSGALAIKMEVVPDIADEVTLHLLAPKSDPTSLALIREFNAGLKLYESRGLRQKLYERRLRGLSVR
ncbi:hypothetical protein [Allohahella marinimesophila]|uniref:LysR substrate binding domain-containing protein n=1 Tax=Allohahella marinimesophila TaxID=1054972 RepID=A0ABP7NJH7_9GAMM